MRIENIRSIKNFRIFQDWSPPSTFDGFSDINLIYANNGSGKSTLATLLSPPQSIEGWKAGVRLDVSGPDSSETRSVVSAQDSFWDRVSVFNKAYIADCFDFESGEAKALLTIGKTNADREKELRTTRAQLDQLARDYQTLEKETKLKQSVPNSILKGIGTLVTSTLGGVEGYGRGYDSRSVSKQLPHAMTAEDRSTFDVKTEIAKAQSAYLKKVEVPKASIASSVQTATIEAALGRAPTARLLDALAAKPEHSAWVQKGVDLHEDSDTCLFCTGTLSQERMEALTRHFDASTRELQEDLRLLIGQVEKLDASLTTLPGTFPDSGLLYPEYRNRYASLHQALEAQVEKDIKGLTGLKKLMEQKLDNLHVAISLPREWRNRSYGGPNVKPLTEVLNEHNDRSSRFDAVRKTACARLEAYWIGEQKVAYVQALNDSKTADAALAANRKKTDAARSRIAELEDAELDPVPPAKWLNKRLHTLLGRSDIRVDPVEGNRYAIFRNGEPALHLSEGECTALALLYFVRSLNTRGRNLRDQIVVIDDPVSSLDENFTIGASSLLWAALVQPSVCECGAPPGCRCGQKLTRDCGQVFLMTHNFELFRIWSNQLDRLKEGVRKQRRSFKILELQAQAKKVEVGVARRVPTWRDWGSDKDREDKALRTRLRSEYHYLFWRAATTLISCGESPTIEHEMDAAIILPNVCRRLLEGFLSFKFPAQMGDFRVQMQMAIDAMDDGLTRQRMVNYLHQYSHQERVETTRGVNRPEAVLILHAVFELIQNQDAKHFTQMCEALGLDSHLLVDNAPREDEELAIA
ncbi:AAA family ATPase [Crystallibacter degradans]|uniref:AAA family ATPase n=1 Tax=Crystallibacter degradans TaxID=2726743 RepID=UPI001472EA97|nr:AAA family ATPase [Arthrobacter sp. SF27]NMR30693.1 AAA family ATPase [Arthrobacter sp. SF27]